MTKSIVTVVVTLLLSQTGLAKSSISFTQEELKTLSPFDPDVQQRVLKDVVQLMSQAYDAKVEVPQVRVSESVGDEETEVLQAAESQGMPGWALSKGVNMYLFKLNLIVLGEEMKIHNLAHEYAHYVQLKYKKYSQDSFSMDYTEMEAVEVQRNFKPL